MNQLSGVIKKITKDEDFQLVDIQAQEMVLCAVSTEQDKAESLLKVGDTVAVRFKETAMSISQNLSGAISIQNHFPCLVTSITRGQVLSKVLLEYNQHAFVSVITTASVIRMGLNPGDSVLGLVKTTDMFFTKIES